MPPRTPTNHSEPTLYLADKRRVLTTILEMQQLDASQDRKDRTQADGLARPRFIWNADNPPPHSLTDDELEQAVKALQPKGQTHDE